MLVRLWKWGAIRRRWSVLFYSLFSGGFFLTGFGFCGHVFRKGGGDTGGGGGDGGISQSKQVTKVPQALACPWYGSD